MDSNSQLHPAVAGEAGGPRRRALVTGASSGIGEAFADRLARDQYDLVVVARRGDRLEALAKRLESRSAVRVDVEVADLTDPDDVARLEALVDPLDLLVNNAGFGTTGPFAERELERELREIQLNVVALVRLTRAALPGMLARGRGGIINVSSLAGEAPTPYNATYGATKAFVTSFTEALYEEARGSGVRIQALLPGFTRTEFQAEAGVETSNLPDFAWMSPEAVVDASLESLARGGAVCVPGAQNRVLSGLQRLVPRSLRRRVLAAVTRSALQPPR